MSLQGANRFGIGPGVVPYQMSTSGATQLSGIYTSPNSYATAIDHTLDELLALQYESLYGDDYKQTLGRSIDLGQTITQKLAANTVATVFPSNNSLADQLKMVARMIKICSDTTVGIQRQVYFVQLGGFDTHTGQITNPAVGVGGQSLQLQRLSAALGAFAQALTEIGMDNNVLTFTMSDFSRTLSSNGGGSDHAWGGNHIVMGNTDTLGGPLRGGRVYGNFPPVVLNGNNSLDRGQMIPDTSVEQMMAPMATWMGVQPVDLGAVFPNLANLGAPLGYLA